jgi:hypothetical protein
MSCAGLSADDQDRLRWAAVTLVSQRGLVMRVVETIGGGLDRVSRMGGRFLGTGWRDRVDALAEDAMWRGYRVAILGLKPAGTRRPLVWLHKAMASASGAASGFLGMPGLAVDLPVTTTLILRSIAEIARESGEDISTDDTRRACLEVFAFGGPVISDGDGSQTDDEAERGYWAARMALNFLPTERLVVQAARVFGGAISQKILAQAVPGVGAVAGGSLNYVFMTYYQQMARVHFTVRSLERSTGDPAGVRACFDALVREAREARRPRPRAARPVAPMSANGDKRIGFVAPGQAE